MGTITRALANNITTGGVVASSGVSNTSVSGVTSLPSGIELNDKLQLISSQTASGDASLNSTSGLDSTYDIYCFRFYQLKNRLRFLGWLLFAFGESIGLAHQGIGGVGFVGGLRSLERK